MGGPLSPRAGRVAKEMTVGSAEPRRAAPAGRGLERRRFRFRSLPPAVPLPPPGRPRAFHRHLASLRRRPLLPRAPRGLPAPARHGSRSVRLPLRPPARRRHGRLPFPAQHGEVLRGRGRRAAPAAALRLLRHAGLASLHGGEAGGAQRLVAGGREPDGEKGSGGMGSSPGTGPNPEPESPAAVLGGGIGSGRELPRLGGRAPVASPAARASPCGEAPSDADRPLPAPSRLPPVPAPLSRLTDGGRRRVGVKGKRGTTHLLLRGRGK